MTTTVAPVRVTFAGDKDADGILRLGKRSSGVVASENNDFNVKSIFAKPARGASTASSKTYVDIVVAYINTQRDIYNLYQAFEDTGDAEAAQNVGARKRGGRSTSSSGRTSSAFEEGLLPKTEATMTTSTCGPARIDRVSDNPDG